MVSKLYNTLEQIRKNEAVPAANGGVSVAPSGSPDRGILKTALLVGVGIGLIVLAYILAPKIGALITKNNGPVVDASKIISQPAVRRGQTDHNAGEDQDTAALNKQAVTLIKNNQHWQAIRMLLQANSAAPGEIEPIINLGVAFAEIGLYGPANRYFALAYGLEPGHIVLRKNMSILRAAGLLEKPLSFYFRSGEMGMDKR